jgi:hypothetical protein
MGVLRCCTPRGKRSAMFVDTSEAVVINSLPHCFRMSSSSGFRFGIGSELWGIGWGAAMWFDVCSSRSGFYQISARSWRI